MSNENIKIEDNFLAQGDFDNLHNIMMTPEFPWFLSGIIDSRADVDKFQFIHFFYKDYLREHRILLKIHFMLI